MKNNLHIFNVTNKADSLLEDLYCKPAGVGPNIFPEHYIDSKVGENIQHKDPYYAEYVFHYWFWKNQLINYDNDTWLGFCQYRRYWLKENCDEKIVVTRDNLKDNVLNSIPSVWANYDAVIAKRVYVDNTKFMKLIKLKVKTKMQEYPIIIGSNLVSDISKIVKSNSIYFKKCLLIIDKNISKKIIFKIKKSLNKKSIYVYFFKAHEKNKNQKSVNKILKILLEKNFSREDCLISVGGGITGDVTGFAASLFKRGLKFINIPTTLLSQVDSSIGGKTGVNTKYGKNLIGSFYQPNLVISDIQFLKTLPKREVICGYGEILKHSIISNKKFFYFLDENIKKIINLSSPFIEKAIYESCKIKKNVVERDEKEKDLRKILNFGHTFAHAYEASLGYSKKLNHGEAVILGIKSALNFSLEKNLLKKNEYNLIINHISKANLPSNINKFFKIKNLNKILSFMLKDKKNNTNKINLVLLKKIGSPIINKEYKKNVLGDFLRNELRN